jgi:hypothetical protein
MLRPSTLIQRKSATPSATTTTFGSTMWAETPACAVDLVADEEGDHRAPRGAGVDRHVEPVALEEAALLADVELREGGIDSGRDGELRRRLCPRQDRRGHDERQGQCGSARRHGALLSSSTSSG